MATGWVFAGPPGDGPAVELGDPLGEVAEGVGVTPTLAERDVAGADGVAVSVGVCAGVVCVVRPPTTPPTVVPPPCRCQTTAFSGLPTDNSNTVMAATATRNVPTAIPVITSQRGLVFLPPPSLAAAASVGPDSHANPPQKAREGTGTVCNMVMPTAG